MKDLTSFECAQRRALIVLALFPTLWGIFSFLNNVGGFSSTAQFAVYPLLTMENTYGNPAQTWRAIDSMAAAHIGLVAITAFETIAGLLGLASIVYMVRNRLAPYDVFAKGKALLVYASLSAILVWGVGFMVVAGDWFLAWQAKENPLATQVGAMVYAVPCLFTVIACFCHRETR